MCDSAGNAGRAKQIEQLLTELRLLARMYARVRGRSLTLTNEIGELEAELRLLVQLMTARDLGHDAIDTDGSRVCIRSRVVPDLKDPGPICINGLKIGASWDAVVLVLLNAEYELLSIYRADRADLERAMRASHNRRRTERPAFAIKTFVNAGRQVWPVE
jgi:hypothetical protein